MNKGKVIQVIGSTFDAVFDEENIPAIYHALKIEAELKEVKLNLTGEVQQHLGGGKVRAVALGSTDGLARGMEVIDRQFGDGAGGRGDARQGIQPGR